VQSQQRRQARIDIWWGKAERLLQSKFGKEGKIDFLFLDGLPSEYLAYLKAAEAHLSCGAVVVADNAGVFSQGGLKPYLDYVRGSPLYESSFVEVPLEWRDDVPDGFEISTFKGCSP
jgi:predicted O-methyltransferase YrrM